MGGHTFPAAWPDVWMTIAREAKRGMGEDSYCRCFCENGGLLAAFDGCGGLGGRRHKCYQGSSEAYVASRLCAAAFYDAFQALFPHKTGDASEEFRGLAARYCARALGDNRPRAEDEAPKLRGSMVKCLPTTACAALLQRTASAWEIDSIWAGDSRAYLLTEEGLCQLTQDDTTVPDPMENLYEDGVLRNVLCVDSAPRLHSSRVRVSKPFVALAATDGCFNYFSTPMEFEGALLDALGEADSAEQWEALLTRRIGAVAGDDFTLCLAAYGFGTFSKLKRALDKRRRELTRAYLRPLADAPLDDRVLRQTLWARYRPEYMRYIEGEE